MKQKLYTIGLLNLAIILTGAIFKVNHWPLAGILLSIGIGALVLVFIPLALVNSYRHSGTRSEKGLYIVAGITCFVVFTAMLFKIMHWPFAGLVMTIALPFPYVVFLPVFLIVTSRNSHFSVYNTVFVLFLLALSSVFNALLSLNVTRYKIDDSFNISGSINNLKQIMVQIPVDESNSPLIQKFDETLSVIDQYQSTILKQVELTEEEWNKNSGSLTRPDARDIVLMALDNDPDMSEGLKLKNALNNLIEAASSIRGYEEVARAISSISALQPAEGDKPYSAHFTDDYLIWSLVYLDGLETNMRLLKASLY